MPLNEIDSIVEELNRKDTKSMIDAHNVILDSTPLFDVEVSTLCNLNCIMCPRDRISRKKGLMKPNIFQRLVEWLPHNAKVMFSGMGEQLLNPHVTSYIGDMKRKGMIVGITTNGQLLTPEKVMDLIDSRIDMIQVSLNGGSKDTYESIMRGGNFNLVRTNLDYLSSVRPPGLTVQLSVVRQERNKDDIMDIERFAENHGFSLLIRNIHTRGGYLKLQDRFLREFKGPRGCGIFAKLTFVASDGSILACCHDLEGHTRFGSIESISFDELKNVKRNLVKNNKWFRICSDCDDEYRYLLLKDHTIVD